MSSNLETIGLVAGGTFTAAAIAWRSRRYSLVRKRIRTRLTDPDRDVRIEAVQQAAEIGLASLAPSLLRATRLENDPAVLAVVIEAVASRQWEPASTAAVVELRMWAKAYSNAHPEVRRLRATEPMLPGVAGSVPPPSIHPLREHEFRRRTRFCNWKRCRWR